MKKRFIHFRKTDDLAKGGATVCCLKDEDDQSFHVGIAMCSAEQAFNKSDGRMKSERKALGGAKDNLHFPVTITLDDMVAECEEEVNGRWDIINRRHGRTMNAGLRRRKRKDASIPG